MVAIFNHNFTLNGRLYTRLDNHYQGLGKEKRAEITINGDPVVELDFCGLHPHLLYAKEGIQFVGDPYSIVDDRPEARLFLKIVLLCMMNNKDEISAERAANYWLYKNPSEREQLIANGIVAKARPFVKKTLGAHIAIAHYLCSRNHIVLWLMYLDSAIALDIVDHFAKQGIPILAIHDCFIVQGQYRAELYQTMKKIFREHTGFTIPIK